MKDRPILLALGLVIAAAALAGACKKTHVTCADPPEKAREYDDVDDGIRRMAEAASRDPTFCRELASPRIALLGDDVVLSGPKDRIVARRGDLPTHEIRRVDRLHESLKSFRSQLKLVRPTADTREIELRLDPALETPRAASIILSAVYAGYPAAQITMAGTTFPVTWFRHGPPDANYIETVLYIESSSETKTTLQVRGPVCKKSAAVTVENHELGRAIARLCRENAKTPHSREAPERHVTRCVDAVELRVLPTARFAETAALLRTCVTALVDQKPTVEIALLLAGSEPKMKMFPKSMWPGVSVYAPAVDASGHCTLPDGGYEEELHFPDAGPLIVE